MRLTSLKGVFVGSGSEGLQQPEVVTEILSLAGTAPTELNVLYIGTPTYEKAQSRENQTKLLAAAGCSVTHLKTTLAGDCTAVEMEEACAAANIIVVSGGNTLYGIDRWRATGLDRQLKAAGERGALLCGGSAGAICWFDGGHSDSGDPDTYISSAAAPAPAGADEATTFAEGGVAAQWDYVRCPGLGFLPGLCCPHFDKTQSNGVLRAHDFDEMMLRHPGERGVCIDHFAALIVDGARYRVLSLPGKPGSVLGGAFSEARAGLPGVWVKEVAGGEVKTWLAPADGSLDELLREPTAVVEDRRLAAIRAANPSPKEL